MNNKGQFNWFTVIILLMVIALLWIAVIVVLDANGRKDECKLDCKEYNAVFVDYESGDFSPEECWCRRGGDPLRIW